MPEYYVNTVEQANGDHEVHKESCLYMPSRKVSLGNFTNCYDAVREAKKHYQQSNGCYYCARPCHTS